MQIERSMCTALLKPVSHLHVSLYLSIHYTWEKSLSPSQLDPRTLTLPLSQFHYHLPPRLSDLFIACFSHQQTKD